MSSYFYSLEMNMMQVSAYPWRGLEKALGEIADEDNQ